MRRYCYINDSSIFFLLLELLIAIQTANISEPIEKAFRSTGWTYHVCVYQNTFNFGL